jgi:hypothetical protein
MTGFVCHPDSFDHPDVISLEAADVIVAARGDEVKQRSESTAPRCPRRRLPKSSLSSSFAASSSSRRSGASDRPARLK